MILNCNKRNLLTTYLFIIAQDAVSSLEKKSDELENSNVDEDSEENDEALLDLLQGEASYFVEELQNLLLCSRNIDIEVY